MRLISIRPSPVARIFAIIYTFFGLTALLLFAFSGAQYIKLPFGVVAPLFYLNINLSLARPDGVWSGAFLCLATILSYTVTGWITGIAVTVCFNFVAKRVGGIDSKYFSFAADKESVKLEGSAGN